MPRAARGMGRHPSLARHLTAIAGDLAGCLAPVWLRNHSPYPRTGSVHGPGVGLLRARGYRHNTGTTKTGEPTSFMDYWDAEGGSGVDMRRVKARKDAISGKSRTTVEAW